jgi:hypothetical protein
MKNNTKERLKQISKDFSRDEPDEIEPEEPDEDTNTDTGLPELSISNLNVSTLMLRKRYNGIIVEMLASAKTSKETSMLFNQAVNANRTLVNKSIKKSKVGFGYMG